MNYEKQTLFLADIDVSGTATITFSGNAHANDKRTCDVPLRTLQKYNIKDITGVTTLAFFRSYVLFFGHKSLFSVLDVFAFFRFQTK